MAQIWLGRKLDSGDQDETVEYKPGSMPTFKFKKSRVYLCIGNDLDDEEDDILANPNTPALGSTLSGGYPVKNRKATEVARVIHPVTQTPTILWEVEVSSDSSLSFAFPGGTIITPETRPPILKWTTNEEEVDFDYDVRTGEPITNVNGEPIFDTRKIVYPVLNYTRYESYYLNVPELQRLYANTLNQTIFFGFPSESCLMLPIEVEEEQFEIEGSEGLATVTYNKVTYRIECKVNDYYGSDAPFTSRYLNEGYYVRPAPGALPVMNAPNGNKTRINLKADGTALALGDDPIWLPYNKYKIANWTDLDLYDPTL